MTPELKIKKLLELAKPPISMEGVYVLNINQGTITPLIQRELDKEQVEGALYQILKLTLDTQRKLRETEV